MEHRKCECCREKFLLKDMKDDLCVCCYNFIQKRKDKTIADLEAKLAEKEKEIEVLKTQRDLWKGLYNHKNKNQDKISFAVEQILDIKEKSFGTRKTGIIFDIPKTQDVFNNIEDKLKELMGDEYDW